MTKLSDDLVKRLPLPEQGNKVTYDAAVKGFGARVTAAGARAFILNYRRKSDALQRRYTIGSFPDWSTATARDEAKRLKREIDTGGDPIGEQHAERGAPTVADLCERFIEEHVSKKRPSTARDYKGIVEEIKTELGKMKVASVDFEDIDRLHREITKRAPYRANRTLAVASKMFSLAVRWRLRTDNPCRGVERNTEHKRKRYLSADELVRLGKALEQYGGQSADIFRFLLLTGARCGETLTATWDQFSDDLAVWTKPHTNTKQKQDHVVPLSPPARTLLRRIREEQGLDETLVFPGRRGHRSDLKHAWTKICAMAGITGLRVHDLRHSYASTVISSGWSLSVVGALLGHTQPNTTARYAHLVDDVLQRATDTAGAVLSGAPAAEVVPLKGGRRG